MTEQSVSDCPVFAVRVLAMLNDIAPPAFYRAMLNDAVPC